ncbi:MAG: hypothetical protein JSV88_22685, partial [Candidatus Aminicenantes bacterium]
SKGFLAAGGKSAGEFRMFRGFEIFLKMTYNYYMDKDKTKTKDKTGLISPDVTKRLDEDITASNQPTVESEKYDTGQTIRMKDDSTADKTSFLFDKSDIQKKLQDELAEVPEISPEEMNSEYLSRLISKPFAHKTEEERLKINRNFLRDAEPLTLDRLKEDINKAPEELCTGFSSLDQWVSIPNRKLTLIASRPGHGKTVFMLNMFLNMCRKYPGQHFLYYTYGEFRQDVEIKLINICGEKPFSSPGIEGATTNFKRWQYELKHQDIDTLKVRAEKEPEYKGLKNFLAISSRAHVIDANYNIVDLLDSVQAFNNTLPIGAVFIDYLQALRPEKGHLALTRQQQVQEISDRLIQLGSETNFPLILGAQFALGEKSIPEYDGLSLEYLKDITDPEHVASLIIGLQNYSKSIFIGSNINDHFKSRFYNYPLKKAEKMPESFKDKHPNTVILAKVLVNRRGPQPEVELMFNKWLMKISDLKKENIPTDKDEKIS